MTEALALAGVDLLVGIDDTDNAYTPGTGRRARALLRELAAAGLGAPAGATRHQLLVDDRIPYTSHNSSACLAWRSADGDPTGHEAKSSNSPGDSWNRSAHPTPTPASPSSFLGISTTQRHSSSSVAAPNERCCIPAKPANSPQLSGCICRDTAAPGRA